jgi:hypothetical protein
MYKKSSTATISSMANTSGKVFFKPKLYILYFSIKVLREIVHLCEELWIEDPTCRRTSLNIKKQLKGLSESVENELSNINTESQQQPTQNDGPWTA